MRPVLDETDLDAYEQDLIAGFVLARSAAGVTDKSIQAEPRAVGEFRESMGRHLWTARPDDADRLLGQRCRGQAKATIAGKAFAISVFSPATWPTAPGAGRSRPTGTCCSPS
jgi:hypothetical protein